MTINPVAGQGFVSAKNATELFNRRFSQSNDTKPLENDDAVSVNLTTKARLLEKAKLESPVQNLGPVKFVGTPQPAGPVLPETPVKGVTLNPTPTPLPTPTKEDAPVLTGQAGTPQLAPSEGEVNATPVKRNG